MCVGKLTIHPRSTKSSLPFSLPLRHSRDKLSQVLSCFSLLQATESWAEPRNEATKSIFAAISAMVKLPRVSWYTKAYKLNWTHCLVNKTSKKMYGWQAKKYANKVGWYDSEGKFIKPHPYIFFTLVGLCKFPFTIISSYLVCIPFGMPSLHLFTFLSLVVIRIGGIFLYWYTPISLDHYNHDIFC